MTFNLLLMTIGDPREDRIIVRKSLEPGKLMTVCHCFSPDGDDVLRTGSALQFKMDTKQPLCLFFSHLESNPVLLDYRATSDTIHQPGSLQNVINKFERNRIIGRSY